MLKSFNYQKIIRLFLVLFVSLFFFLMFFLAYANLSLFLNREERNSGQKKKGDDDTEDDEDDVEQDKKQLEFLKNVIKNLVQEKILKYSLDFNLRDELVFKPNFFEYLFFSQIFKTMLPFKINSFKFHYDESLRFVKVEYFDEKKKLFLDWNFSLSDKNVA